MTEKAPQLTDMSNMPQEIARAISALTAQEMQSMANKGVKILDVDFELSETEVTSTISFMPCHTLKQVNVSLTFNLSGEDEQEE